MNRRSFLSMMGFVSPAVIVKPTYFFAPTQGWHKVHKFDTLLPPNLRFYNDPPIATIFDPCATGLPQLPIEYACGFDPELRQLGMHMAYRMAKTIDMLCEQQWNSTGRRMQ